MTLVVNYILRIILSTKKHFVYGINSNKTARAYIMKQVSSFWKKKCNVNPKTPREDCSLTTMLYNVNSFRTKLKLFLLNIGKSYYQFSKIMEKIKNILVAVIEYAFEQL